MQTTLDRTTEADARRMLCGIMYFFDTHGEWPHGGRVNNLGGYKAAGDKPAMWAFLAENGWLTHEEEPGQGHRIKRLHVVTEKGRDALRLPEPLPPKPITGPYPFPDDPVESRIFGFHMSFFNRHGRWPTGVERARVFNGEKSRKISPERRRRAYQALVEDGIFVRIIMWRWKGEEDRYVMPDFSPEFENLHETLYYAPNLST